MKKIKFQLLDRGDLVDWSSPKLLVERSGFESRTIPIISLSLFKALRVDLIYQIRALFYYSNFWIFIIFDETTLFLDVWSNLGHFKTRRVITTMCAVREPSPIVIKAAKFHSLMTYCGLSPLNWVYCPQGFS